MMNFALCLCLGFLIRPGFCEFPPGSCDGYANITEPWRNRQFSTSFPGYPKDDASLLNNWWRFAGIGGDRVITGCLSRSHGGTENTIHLPFTHPTTQSVNPTTGTAYGHTGGCTSVSFSVSVSLCPGGFYVYKPLGHPHSSMGYATYHHDCQSDSCGPSAKCTSDGGCVCVDGREIPSNHQPTPDSFGCVDIDECDRTPDICGSNSVCSNIIESYTCACEDGYEATDPKLPPDGSNKCTDIDECVKDVCGGTGDCLNNPGGFSCQCHKGYEVEPASAPVCQDIDECLDSSLCGPDATCTNKPGEYSCACFPGFATTSPTEDPSESNNCIDVDECAEDTAFCGPNSNCTNSIGSHMCTCFPGYQPTKPDGPAGSANPCTDIDECSETPGLCGKKTVCTNAMGTFYCSCPEGFYPSTGILWEVGVSFCKSLTDILAEITPPEGQTKERVFLDNMDQQLQDNTGIILAASTVTNCFSASMEVSGVGPHSLTARAGSDGDGETGSVILGIADQLIATMVPPNENKTETVVQTSTVDLNLLAIGPGTPVNKSVSLAIKELSMEINLQALADTNNGSAAASFMTLNGMGSLLNHKYFESENQTEMNSDVFTAILPINNTNLTEPVNFTIQHKKKVPESGMVTCVYWEGKVKKPQDEGENEEADTMRWSVKGCWVSYSNENYTVCSCSHLSTFALIMQIGEPPPESNFLEWLNRLCVMVGLFFFTLAVITFLLCSWNPKINNTARLHLCLSLGLSHLLLLWNDRYLDNELACTVMAGILHFLVVASFVWMLLEAVQLYMLVRRLSKVQVIQRDGLPKLLLYLIGYGVPFVVVGVSALVYSDGYGATEGDACWLSKKRNFNWALTGPVIAILGMNWMLFCATLWSLRPTLANMRSDVSQSKDTKLIVFKILAQFIILGCTWILGLYQANLFLQILFIVLNSQQGTFLYIVHCLLNKEVREEYIRFLSCSCRKDRSEQAEGPSVTED